jgi:hypothetical protein
MITGVCKTCIHHWLIRVGKIKVIMCIKDTYNPKRVGQYDKCNYYKQQNYYESTRIN